MLQDLVEAGLHAAKHLEAQVNGFRQVWLVLVQWGPWNVRYDLEVGLWILLKTKYVGVYLSHGGDLWRGHDLGIYLRVGERVCVDRVDLARWSGFCFWNHCERKRSQCPFESAEMLDATNRLSDANREKNQSKHLRLNYVN